MLGSSRQSESNHAASPHSFAASPHSFATICGFRTAKHRASHWSGAAYRQLHRLSCASSTDSEQPASMLRSILFACMLMVSHLAPPAVQSAAAPKPLAQPPPTAQPASKPADTRGSTAGQPAAPNEMTQQPPAQSAAEDDKTPPMMAALLLAPPPPTTAAPTTVKGAICSTGCTERQVHNAIITYHDIPTYTSSANIRMRRSICPRKYVRAHLYM